MYLALYYAGFVHIWLRNKISYISWAFSVHCLQIKYVKDTCVLPNMIRIHLQVTYKFSGCIEVCLFLSFFLSVSTNNQVNIFNLAGHMKNMSIPSVCMHEIEKKHEFHFKSASYLQAVRTRLVKRVCAQSNVNARVCSKTGSTRGNEIETKFCQRREELSSAELITERNRGKRRREA